MHEKPLKIASTVNQTRRFFGKTTRHLPLFYFKPMPRRSYLTNDSYNPACVYSKTGLFIAPEISHPNDKKCNGFFVTISTISASVESHHPLNRAESHTPTINAHGSKATAKPASARTLKRTRHKRSNR